MSTGEGVSNSLIKIEVPKSIDNMIYKLTDKPAATIGQIVSDCLLLVFGDTNQKAELRRLQYAYNIKNFANELEKKIEDIPEENRVEPKIHTVCTALESMKYCVEEPELRNMFSTLIANSMNANIYERVHPSYGEIIRQLTPYDAKLINWMKTQRGIPAIRFRLQIKEKDEYIQMPTIYLEYGQDSLDLLQVSLENLSRLKVVNLNLETEFADKSLYENVKEKQKYVIDKEKLETEKGDNKILLEKYGVIEISQFGKRFIETCC